MDINISSSEFYIFRSGIYLMAGVLLLLYRKPKKKYLFFGLLCIFFGIFSGFGRSYIGLPEDYHSFNLSSAIIDLGLHSFIFYLLVVSITPQYLNRKSIIILFTSLLSIALIAMICRFYYPFYEFQLNESINRMEEKDFIPLFLYFLMSLCIFLEYVLIIFYLIQIAPICNYYLSKKNRDLKRVSMFWIYSITGAYLFSFFLYVYMIVDPSYNLLLLRQGVEMFCFMWFLCGVLRPDLYQKLFFRVKWSWKQTWYLDPDCLLEENEESSLSEDKMEILKKQAEEWINEDEKYLQEDLKIADLHRSLNVKRFEIRELFIYGFTCNFRTWVNTHRIQYAKELMKKHPHWMVKQIALDCGFTHHSHFTRTFTAQEGLSPKEWLVAFEKRLSASA